MTCWLIQSLLSFRVSENFPKLNLNKSRIKNKNTQIKTGQGMIRSKVVGFQMLKISLSNFSKSNLCSYLAVIGRRKGFIARMEKTTVLGYIWRKRFFVIFE